jgi:hypothetical protein
MNGAGDNIVEELLTALCGEENICDGVVGLVVELTTGLSVVLTRRQRFLRLK